MITAEIPGELGVGLATGALGAAAVVATSSSQRRRASAGAAFSVAGLAAVATGRPVPWAVVVAVAAIGLAAALAQRPIRGRRAARVVLALGAGWLLATRGDLVEATWVRTAVAVAVAVGAPLAARFERRWSEDGVTPVLVAASVLGLFLAVPDTEEAAALLGAVAPLAAVGVAVHRVRWGPAGTAMGLVVLVWCAAIGSRGRPAALVGALTCLGVLVLWPAVRATVRRPGAPIRARSARLAVVTVHVAMVVVGARLLGPADDPALAAVAAGAVVVGAGATLRRFVPDAPPTPTGGDLR